MHLIQKIVRKRMDGSIEVESRLGVGSTFTVRLPLRVADKATSP